MLKINWAVALDPEFGMVPPFVDPLADYWWGAQPITMYQTQSGVREQYYQYVAGQQSLLNAEVLNRVQHQRLLQKIGESLTAQYVHQIDQQTGQRPSPPIVLPNM